MAKVEATLTIFDDGTFELKDDKGSEIPVHNRVSDPVRNSVSMRRDNSPQDINAPFINTACWYSGSPI